AEKHVPRDRGSNHDLSQLPPTLRSTLAACYAAGGRFEDAVETQQQAIDLLKAQGPVAATWRARLARYQAGQRCIDDPAATLEFAPEYRRYHILCGQKLYQQGSSAAAVPHLRGALNQGRDAR